MKFNFPEFDRRARPGEERRGEVVDRLSGKLSKQTASYRPSIEDENKSCSECAHNVQPGKPASNCQVVAGTVYDEDVCDDWKARAGEFSVQPPTQNRS